MVTLVLLAIVNEFGFAEETKRCSKTSYCCKWMCKGNWPGNCGCREEPYNITSGMYCHIDSRGEILNFSKSDLALSRALSNLSRYLITLLT